jgi:ABC-type Fe3+ transport system permease subunit
LVEIDNMLQGVPLLVVILILTTIAVSALTWSMRRLGLRAQFLVLLVLGVLIGFLFLILVQVPDFPHWLAILLIMIVFVACQFGLRIFLQTLNKEEQDEDAGARRR